MNIEKETQIQFCTVRDIRKRKNYSQREYIYHRSYVKKSNLTKHKGTSKSLDTNKIGVACPSRMIVQITAKKVIVNFTAVHVGYLNEVIRMKLPTISSACHNSR